MSGKIGVLALQGDVREHVSVLAELGAYPVEVRRPEDLAGIDGIVVPGGESTTMALLLESAGLRQPLADQLRGGMAAFGTCAGMILLARQVLDGRRDQTCFGVIDISVRRNAFGRQVDSFETDLDVPELGAEPVHGVFIRAPLVERAGPEVEVLAEVDGRPVACRQGPVLVTSFHPELSGDLRLHDLFLKGVG
ncbi:MAG: pyridoxal 5-phosphate synthase pdxT subunit [Acidimicrobiaceae bacterium]|nr:pyridoxal 5-phosphate synthase pdxT subunit [Acidimicrobiaceae bacterium]MDQ1365712.1 pyridoxal 5-phosphate synthase pdxT subunit [Acidimicrobiaceae bacterium]MDQ1378240.1 pyridoxal 5-phosphate synthase pdxT subunit [Acidimicrobiaceae bacterium]MDQ1398292.1 pyridoxal 5-phosphate synthase pdxT subunit [Acidimicrobiaceae bacterium]MDQ1414765.1 pyridoxal 5-phosphate synthase pdxT subunit [Acidimicrobiaceae bacterium]